jgi:hypothetical protein
MEFLPLVRVIWRRRLWIAAGAILAVAIAVALGGSPPSSSAVAWTRVALDTPTSQLLKSAPNGADTLPWRASLLIRLMGTDSTQRELAGRLGVRPDQVTVVDTALDVPLVPASMPLRASEAASVAGAPYVLTVDLKTPALPLISIEAAAPGRAGAKRLAEAAVAVLESRSSQEGGYSSRIPTGGGAAAKFQPFLAEQVAPVRVKPVVASELPIAQLAAPVVFLALWWTGVLLLPALLRRRIRPAVA